MLKELLLEIGTSQATARKENFAGHSLGTVLRDQAPDILENLLSVGFQPWMVKGSVGQSRWAEVFWIATMNPIVTTSAQQGYYLVYLFHAKSPIVYLSLNQGATIAREEFGRDTRVVLKERASFMRGRIPEYIKPHQVSSIQLGSRQTLPRDYEAGHVTGYSYKVNDLPSEQELVRDFLSLCEAYAVLEYRGGAENIEDVTLVEGDLAGVKDIEELRQYRAHFRIERNSKAAREVKKFHGYDCQACDENFYNIYGEIGKNYIEAHHKKPLSSLKDELVVRYDVEKDFAVLCSNCHRMIHKLDDPADIEQLREIIRINKKKTVPGVHV